MGQASGKLENAYLYLLEFLCGKHKKYTFGKPKVLVTRKVHYFYSTFYYLSVKNILNSL